MVLKAIPFFYLATNKMFAIGVGNHNKKTFAPLHQ